MGTWLLGILDGQERYAHIGAQRGDGVAPEVLGMSKIIGDDSLRRALGTIAPAPKAKHNAEERIAQQAQALKAEQWMQAQLRHSIAQATQTGWILDCDTTVKVLHGPCRKRPRSSRAHLIVTAALRATGDVIYPVAASVSSFIVVLGLGSYVLGRSLGLPGIFIAYAADEWVRGLLMMARWHWHGWVPHARDAMRRVRRA